MFLNDTGYAEVFDVPPEVIYAERARAEKVESEIKQRIGVLTIPFQRCNTMATCRSVAGCYPESHPDISLEEMNACERAAKDAYNTRRQTLMAEIHNRTAEIIPLFG